MELHKYFEWLANDFRKLSRTEKVHNSTSTVFENDSLVDRFRALLEPLTTGIVSLKNLANMFEMHFLSYQLFALFCGMSPFSKAFLFVPIIPLEQCALPSRRLIDCCVIYPEWADSTSGEATQFSNPGCTVQTHQTHCLPRTMLRVQFYLQSRWIYHPEFEVLSGRATQRALCFVTNAIMQQYESGAL